MLPHSRTIRAASRSPAHPHRELHCGYGQSNVPLKISPERRRRRGTSNLTRENFGRLTQRDRNLS
jgi:hypothetical protein